MFYFVVSAKEYPASLLRRFADRRVFLPFGKASAFLRANFFPKTKVLVCFLSSRFLPKRASPFYGGFSAKSSPARALPQFLRNALSRRRTAAHTCADRLLFFFPILKFVLAAAFTRNCFAFCLRTESFSHNLAADCALRTFLRKTYPRFPSEHFSIRLFFPFSETNGRAEISPYVLSTREISGD